MFIKHHGNLKILRIPRHWRTSKRDSILYGARKLFLAFANGPATLRIWKTSNFLLPAFNQDRYIWGPEELGILSVGMGVGALLDLFFGKPE